MTNREKTLKIAEEAATNVIRDGVWASPAEAMSAIRAGRVAVQTAAAYLQPESGRQGLVHDAAAAYDAIIADAEIRL
jgi:hypothetical protein